MNQDSMLKPALIGGVLLGILSALPFISYFNCICCAWVILGSVVAARLYVKDSSLPVTLGRGVGLGFLTGAIGTVVSALFSIPLLLLASRGGSSIADQLRQTLSQLMEQMPNVPPETRSALDSFIAEGNIGIFVYIAGFFFMFAVNCVVAMIGGAIGVAVFEKRDTRPVAPPPQFTPPGDAPPPPPADPA